MRRTVAAGRIVVIPLAITAPFAVQVPIAIRTAQVNRPKRDIIKKTKQL
jgi:hypothetical protein